MRRCRCCVTPRAAAPSWRVGAHLKNTVALSVGNQVFISQHIGDLETAEALAAFERVIADFLRLYEATPAADCPRSAPGLSLDPLGATAGGAASWLRVQHHHAHLAACLAENGVEGPALGVIWDGTGYGTDGDDLGRRVPAGRRLPAASAWPTCARSACRAARRPCANRAAPLWRCCGRWTAKPLLERDDLPPVADFCAADRRTAGADAEPGRQCALTTSAGRLFDGVAALLGLHQTVTFEGQAAMALEFAADASVDEEYEFVVERRSSAAGAGTAQASNDPLVLDWQPADRRRFWPTWSRGLIGRSIATRFHNTLTAAIVAVAQRSGRAARGAVGRLFPESAADRASRARLRGAGFDVLLHRQTPPNDGCIALGQVAVAAIDIG